MRALLSSDHFDAARFLRPALIGAVSLFLSACGGSDDDDEVTFTVNYMKSEYLWADQLPANINPSDYTSAADVLAKLRVPQDKFSNIADAQQTTNFFAGRLIGFGFNFQYEGDNIRLYLVQPNSPAAAAGLRRGDVITQIEDKSPAQWQAEEKIDEAFGPSEIGVQRTFVVNRTDGSTFTKTVTKGQYELAYVPASGVFTQDDRTIGYINFYSFSDVGEAPWNDTISSLAAQGAQDLIVDLRFNGGGLISTAARIGSALGTSSMDNRIMTSLTFNSQNARNNRTFYFDAHPQAGTFENLVWLTGAGTCSASEAMIQGLKPFRTSVRIGEATCGKPYGFTPPTRNNKVFNITSFRLSNADGETDYVDGLAPDCTVIDTGLGQLGQSDEVLTAAALTYLSTGSCPVGSSDTNTKSANRNSQMELRGIQNFSNLY